MNTGEIDLLSPKNEREDCALGGPGLDSLLRQKLKQVLTYSGNTCVTTALFSLPFYRASGDVSVPDLSL